MSFSRKGFMLTQSSGIPPITKTFAVLATAANAYFPGDPVRLNSNGELTPVLTSSADVLGVIDAVYENSNGQKRALTFNQPTRGPYLTSGQAGFADVIISKQAIFVAQLDVTASAGLIGSNINVSAGLPNTAAGISGYNLKGSSITTSANGQFKIIGIADTELINGITGDFPAGSGVLVKMNNPQFDQTTGF